MIAENLRAVETRLLAACARAQRPRASVELIAVSKLKPAADIRTAYEAGQRNFGENYAQELRDKTAVLSDLRGLRWHAIGPLQTNKAKYVAKSAHAFHALDRIEIAAELARRRTLGALECFLEVNLAGEASKQGVRPEDVRGLLEKVRTLPNLEVVGLMSLPPLTADPEDARPYFRRLKVLAAELGLPGLSMGTTADFDVAVEEGATHVRVGTAIFGARA